MPFHSMSTTIGNTIYLARDFFDWKRKEQAENLCHECIHLQQFDKMGVNAFISAYAQKAGRLRLEQEAYKTSIAWWIACGEIGSPNLYGSDTVFAASNLRIARIINALLSKYFFGSFVSEAQLIAWAAATVRELMAES